MWSRGTTASTLAPAAALSAVSGRVNGIVNSYFGCERILLALCGGQTQTTPTFNSENRKVWEKFKHICDVVSYTGGWRTVSVSVSLDITASNKG